MAFLMPTPFSAVAMVLLTAALIAAFAVTTAATERREARNAELARECERAFAQHQESSGQTTAHHQESPGQTTSEDDRLLIQWRRLIERRRLPECDPMRYAVRWDEIERRPWARTSLPAEMLLIGLPFYYGLWQVLHARPEPLGRVLTDRRFQAVGIIGLIGVAIWGAFAWTDDSGLVGLLLICHAALLGAAAAAAVVRWGFRAT